MRHAVRWRSMTTTSVAAVAISHGSPGVAPDSSAWPARRDHGSARVGGVRAHDSAASRIEDPQRAVARGDHVDGVEVLEPGGKVDHRGRHVDASHLVQRVEAPVDPALQRARAAHRRRRRRMPAPPRHARRPAAPPRARDRGPPGPRRRRDPRRHAPARPPRRSTGGRRWRAGWRRSAAWPAVRQPSTRPPGCRRPRPCPPARGGGGGPARAQRCAECCAGTRRAGAARRRGSS